MHRVEQTLVDRDELARIPGADRRGYLVDHRLRVNRISMFDGHLGDDALDTGKDVCANDRLQRPVGLDLEIAPPKHQSQQQHDDRPGNRQRLGQRSGPENPLGLICARCGGDKIGLRSRDVGRVAVAPEGHIGTRICRVPRHIGHAVLVRVGGDIGIP